ncbi:50S ribosomal protein L30 [candidate division KSB3 bacterium]|uniref:50S ribosomal protein L30 n=1 Tax=candidate division KSB3 bacterium TaxID=2044937 RepID=A0A2G6E275_9BACT|nr:MAG: 50S ribosomal protein L30 [candidate division KSB3 bacterium]PIE28562.1 MAG: 50S ribosomal protein L30 [candidate division KSB3 bacterium]
MSVLRITLVKSSIGAPKTQRKVLAGLGLRKMNSSVLRKNTPEIRGMIFKVQHLVTVTDVEEES